MGHLMASSIKLAA